MRRPPKWTATLLAAVLVVGWAGSAAAAEPPCGKPPPDAAAGAPPVRADLKPVTPSQVITLGRGTTGSRTWDVDFAWTAGCTLQDTDVKPVVRNLQGEDSSLDAGLITASAVVDPDAHSLQVTLVIPRKGVPAGKFEGDLDIGSGAVGLGRADLTIRHQEPLTVNHMNGLFQVVWIVIGLALAIALFAAESIFRQMKGLGGDAAAPAVPPPADGADGPPTPTGAQGTGKDKPPRNHQDFTTPLGVIVGALALYPLLARIGGTSVVPWPAWPVWLGAVGMMGGVAIGIAKHRDSSDAVALVGGQRFATSLLLAFGAGVTAWRAQYLNSPDWALTVESAMGLVGVVGGATATSALLFFSPAPKPPDPVSQLKPEVAAEREEELLATDGSRVAAAAQAPVGPPGAVLSPGPSPGR